MSSRWWRAYDEAIDDPKLLLLPSDKHRWGWFCLMCLASVYGGVLPSIDIVALKLRTSKHKAAELITSLITAGLIDEIETGKFAPHNWGGRQFQSDVSTERVKRFRQRPRNVSSAVSETPPETETETETERKKDAADAAPDPEKELFARGKQVLGNDAGGLIAKLLKAKNKNVVLARAIIDTASQKQDPREYVSAVIRGPKNGEFKLMSGREGII